MRRTNRRFISVLALALGASVSALPYAVAAAQPAQNDTNLQAEVINKALNKPNLKGVQATTHDGVVTLTGTVPLFALKQEADKRTHKIKGVQAVSNEIQVAGPNLPDSVLEAKLAKAIAYDRVDTARRRSTQFRSRCRMEPQRWGVSPTGLSTLPPRSRWQPIRRG